MKRIAIALGAVALIVSLSPNSASAKAVPKVTGGITMSTPLQAVDFSAFDYGATGDKGEVNYANFEYPATGTNVWDTRGTHAILINGSIPEHLTIISIKPTSPTSSSFVGNGVDDTFSAVTWNITGTVAGPTITFDLVFTGASAPYGVHGTGTIAPDGSVSGSGTDSNAQPVTFTEPAGSAHEVLSFTASVTCAVIATATSGKFVFVVPAGFPGLSGTPVLVKVTDGGSPGVGHDTWSHGVANGPNDCSDVLTNNYPITGGNLVVH